MRCQWRGVAMLVVSALAWASAADAAPLENPYATLRARADAMVTVRFVVRVQMPGVDQEVENEITCLSIGPDGLVLCSNTELGGYFAVMARMMGRTDEAISSSPRDLRVVWQDTSAGLPADLVARDSERDLAWISLRERPAGQVFPYLDFADGAEPVVGERFYQLRRMDPFFGSAAVVGDGVVAAVIEQPRRLIVPSRPAEGYLGTPVFAADGKLLGIAVAQVPGNDDSRAVMSQRSRALPGQAGKEDDMIAGVILPAADVVRATELARQLWSEDQRDAVE